MSIGKSFKNDGPCSAIRCVKIPELCNHVRSCFSGGFPRHFLKAMDVKGLVETTNGLQQWIMRVDNHLEARTKRT